MFLAHTFLMRHRSHYIGGQARVSNSSRLAGEMIFEEPVGNFERTVQVCSMQIGGASSGDQVPLCEPGPGRAADWCPACHCRRRRHRGPRGSHSWFISKAEFLDTAGGNRVLIRTSSVGDQVLTRVTGTMQARSTSSARSRELTGVICTSEEV